MSKPCIAAADECYNVEWSTELRVPQAYDEYVKAWFVLKLLSKEFELGDPNGFIFNMSVGYDLAGIQSPKLIVILTKCRTQKERRFGRNAKQLPKNIYLILKSR